MPDSQDVPDVYVDQVQINTSPYGATINFMLSSSAPAVPGGPQQADPRATVRMSLEHLKMMAFLMQRQIRQHEESLGLRIGIPNQVVSEAGIAPEDWDAFWM